MEDEYDHIAPRITGTREGTFAYLTVRDRWPKIVAGIVDQLARRRPQLIEEYGPAAEADIAAIMNKFSKLRYEIMTDKPLEFFPENGPDGSAWRQYVIDNKTAVMPDDDEDLTYFKGAWLFVECYLYRFIYSAFLTTEKLSELDYFQESKQKNFLDHLSHIEEAANYICKLAAPDAPAHEYFGINIMFKQSLWGNKADMSLTGGEDRSLEVSSVKASTRYQEFIVADDINDMAAHVLLPLHERGTNGDKNRRIDIVLDNAGVELVDDLCLALYLISRLWCDKVVLHGKAIPWFVSDVTERDFLWTIENLEKSGPSGAAFKEELKAAMKGGLISFEADLFWTSPHPYFVMEKEAPALYEHFKKSSLIVFKGDLNYRKLVGDREWDMNTTFKKAIRGFEPCPFIALRTLKAETVAGLDSKMVDELFKKYPEDNSWMTSGQYGLCQLGGIDIPPGSPRARERLRKFLSYF